MKNFKKATAFTMASVMVFSSCIFATGCNKKPAGTTVKIEEDSPWYNIEKYTLRTQYDDSQDIDYIYSQIIGFDGEHLIVSTEGSYKYPDNAWDDPNFNYNDYQFHTIDTYTLDGDQVSSIDVNSGLKDYLTDYDNYYVSDVTYAGTINLTIDAWGYLDPDAEPSEDVPVDENGDIDWEAMYPDAVGSSADVSSKADPEDEEDIEEDIDEDIDEDEEFDDEDLDDYDFDAYDPGMFLDDYYEDHYFLAVFDAATGELLSFEAQDGDNSVPGSFEGSADVGAGYTVSKYWQTDDDAYSYILTITSPDGSISTVDMRDIFPDYSIYDIASFVTVSDTEVVFRPSLDSGTETIYMVLNLATGEITEDDSYSWLDEELFYNGVTYIPGIGNAALKTTGISILNFDTQEEDLVFDFNMCNIKRSDVTYLSLYEYSEDRIVMAGSIWSSKTGIGYQDETIIYVLTKAETNPNVGKIVLTAASLGYLDEASAEAIVQFNEASSEYFVTYTDKYEIEYDYSNADDDTEWYNTVLETQASLSNQLAIDLIAGDGPDIILDASEFRQLNDSEYLLDLSSDFDFSSGYFTNVIDAAKTGDALYQLPTSFTIQGIKTQASNVSAGQTGFTFDEYAEFVDEVCNGDDPLALNQLDAFTTLVVAMNDEFETGDGDINYDCDAFREFAEFIRDNMPEEIQDPYADGYGVEVYEGYGMYDEETSTAEVSGISSFGSFISWDYADGTVLMGLPSFDGRGPMISCTTSAAVSAQTANPDGCKAFVETLLSNEVQEILAAYYCPVNTEAFDTIAALALEERNADIREMMSWYSPAEITQMGLHEFDSSIIDTFQEFVTSATTISSMDAAVQAILREEIPAYFSGQKTIDEVINIIQDKVQTYINERG